MGCGASSMGSPSARAIQGSAKNLRYAPSAVDKLTDAQLEEFQEAFTMFDKDGGGSIDASELKDLMLSVGQNCSDKELRDMVEAADADGTGDIDFLEFAVLMAHKMTDETKDDSLKKAFQVFDSSGDGFIDSNEMRKIMFNLGENLQQGDVEAVIREVDVDGDGQIDYKEFAKILASEKEGQKGAKFKSQEKERIPHLAADHKAHKQALHENNADRATAGSKARTSPE